MYLCKDAPCLSKMDLIRFRYIIHGDVQRVGYRDFVQKLAIKNGIKGEVRNLDELDVQIIAEGKKEAISHFRMQYIYRIFLYTSNRLKPSRKHTQVNFTHSG